MRTRSSLATLRDKLEAQRKPLPAEVLLCIFDLAVGDFDPRKEPRPSIDIGNNSPWSKDLRMKKALVRVCKSWRIVAMPYLYCRVYLHRVGQLCALVKVLENSSRRRDSTGYSFWVHHVHGRFLVPTSWETVYYKNAIRLLTLCTSTRSFFWTITWGSPCSGIQPRFNTLLSTSFDIPNLRCYQFSAPCKNSHSRSTTRPR